MKLAKWMGSSKLCCCIFQCDLGHK